MTVGRKRSFNYAPLIQLKKDNQYIPARAAIEQLGLKVSVMAVRKIWQNAKKEGQISY